MTASRIPERGIHPTAEIEDGVEIGAGTAIWSGVHIRGPGTRIGDECIVGEQTYIAYGVQIGDRVKLNAFVYICTGVTIEDGVMVGAGTIFTNDRFPRATTPDLATLRPSEPDEHTLPTLVGEGATIGAGCVIGCDLDDRPVRDGRHGLGRHPHRARLPPRRRPAGPLGGVVCRCGEPIVRFSGAQPPDRDEVVCPVSGLRYAIRGRRGRRARPARRDRRRHRAASASRGGRSSAAGCSG